MFLPACHPGEDGLGSLWDSHPEPLRSCWGWLTPLGVDHGLSPGPHSWPGSFDAHWLTMAHACS